MSKEDFAIGDKIEIVAGDYKGSKGEILKLSELGNLCVVKVYYLRSIVKVMTLTKNLKKIEVL